MGLRINTNINSLRVQRMLGETARALPRSYARLASGHRIATAADDAAGLGILERMRVEVRSIGVARRNIQHGISFIEVADSALVEVGEILHRSRELALQAANGTLADGDRQILDGERAELALEARRILDTTKFNGIAVFSRDAPSIEEGIEWQIGVSSGETLTVRRPDAIRLGLLLPSLSVESSDRARQSLRVLDIATELISKARGELGVAQLRLDSSARSLQVRGENTSSAMSRIAEVDVAHESAERTRLEILHAAGAAVLGQANLQPNLALELLRAQVERDMERMAG